MKKIEYKKMLNNIIIIKMNINKKNLYEIYKNGFLLCTYSGSIIGFLYGYNQFKYKKNPFINLVGNILNYTLDGILIGITWPITFTLLPFITYDYFLRIDK